MQNHFNLSNVNQINKWKSKGLSNQYLNLNGKMDDVVLSKPIKPMYVIFKGKSILYDHDNNVIAGEPIVNIYIVCKTSSKTINSSFTLKNCLIGAVKITNTTNCDNDKWQYSGYGTGFDSKGEFTHPLGSYGRNVIIFGADLSNSKHSNNNTKNILVFG